MIRSIHRRLGLWLALAVVALPALAAAQTKTPTIKKVPAPQVSPAEGKEMYASYCAPCHGRNGKGDGPAAVALTPKPTDLTLLAKTHHGEYPAKTFADKVNGNEMAAAHGNNEMPVWGPILRRLGNDTLRVYNLKAYVDSLQER